MHRLAIATAIIAMLALAGCATRVPVAVAPNLPDLPARAVQDCPNPVSREGEDLGVIALEWKATAKCERRQKHAVAGYYGNIQRGLAGQ